MGNILPIGGIILLGIASIIWVKEEIVKRPTYKESDKRYVARNECNIITKDFKEKLDCIPEMRDAIVRIETKLDMMTQSGKNEDDNN